MNTHTIAEIAVTALTGWKRSPAIRAQFGTIDAYLTHLERPEESAFVVLSEKDGHIRIEKNKNRRLSPATASEILAAWQNDPALRSEFPSVNCYRAFIESEVTAKSRIIGRH